MLMINRLIDLLIDLSVYMYVNPSDAYLLMPWCMTLNCNKGTVGVFSSSGYSNDKSQKNIAFETSLCHLYSLCIKFV